MEKTIKKQVGTIYLIPWIFFIVSIMISILGIVTNQGYPLAQVIIPKSNTVSLWSSGTVFVNWAGAVQTAARRQAIPAGCLVNCSRKEPKGKMSEESNHLLQGLGGLKSQVAGAEEHWQGTAGCTTRCHSHGTSKHTLGLQEAFHGDCRRGVSSYPIITSCQAPQALNQDAYHPC